jgi:predicted  nucleic acid-binding Zn-ribbon protein
MAEELKIVIGADASQFNAELKKAESELKQFQTQLSKTTDTNEIDSLTKQISQTTTKINDLKSAISKGPSTLKIDASQLIANLDSAESALAKLKADIVAPAGALNVNATGVVSAIQMAEDELQILRDDINKPLGSVIVDTATLQAQLMNIDEELKILASDVQKPLGVINVDATKLVSAVELSSNEINQLRQELAKPIGQLTIPPASVKPIEVPVQYELPTSIPTATIPPVEVPVQYELPTSIPTETIPPVEVPVNVDVTKFNAELVKAENELRKFQSELKKTTDINALTALNGKIELTTKKIEGLKGAMSKVPQSTANAGTAITNLSRIVSDSAYGFIGIANNIQPFIDSLGYARKEAQATGTSLGKNLLGALSGPGGLSLAFAAVTTAITFAQIGFSAWTRSTKAAKDEQQKFNEELKSAEQGAISQGIRLESLVKIITNSAESEKNRNRALEEANNLLKPYGEKIDSINISLSKAKELTDKYTEALINQAIGAKLADKIADLRLKKLDQERQIQEQQLKISEKRAKVSSQANRLDRVQYGTSDAAAFQYLQTEADVSTETENLIGLNKDLSDTQKEIDRLTSQYTVTVEKSLNATSAEIKAKEKNVKKTQTLSEALAEFRKQLDDTQKVGEALKIPQLDINTDKIKEFEGIIKKLIENFNVKKGSKLIVGLEAELNDLQIEQILLKAKDKIQKPILLPLGWKPPSNDLPIPDIAKKIKPIVIPIQVQADLQALQGSIIPKEFTQNVNKDLSKSFAEVSKEWEKYSNDINNAATGFLTDAAVNIAVGFGEALGAALTGGNIGDVFKGVFELLAGGVEQLGKQLIQLGILAVVAQQAIAQLLANPFAAIAVGIALTALGAALKNLTNKKQFAVGTRFAPGGMALVGERGPELINLPRGSQVVPAAQTSQMLGGLGSQIEVFGVLRGQDIYFSNKKYGQTYGRTT